MLGDICHLKPETLSLPPGASESPGCQRRHTSQQASFAVSSPTWDHVRAFQKVGETTALSHLLSWVEHQVTHPCLLPQPLSLSRASAPCTWTRSGTS
uniref:Uncharacterized protein n=1 Tax=Sciurus vulgaris TaxID=55149 RepID=A0A8D2DU44_SCIVU